MPTSPKTLQIFLPQGTPTGIQIAEITTGIVQVISVPRTHLKEFFKRAEADYVATYFLFGGNDVTDKPLAYIGQTEDLKQRLDNHDKQKEFWARAVILVSKTQLFTQAHIRWMEWKSIIQANEAKRFDLKNGNASSKPYVTEVIQAEVEEIFEEGSLLLQSLGYPIFEPLIPKAKGIKAEKWYLKRRGAKATATFTDEGIVVHRGGLLSKDLTNSALNTNISKRRKNMLNDGFIGLGKHGLEFLEDYRFKSPSGAAAVIAGCHANGWIEWKNANGKTLKEVKRDIQASPKKDSNA